MGAINQSGNKKKEENAALSVRAYMSWNNFVRIIRIIRPPVPPSAPLLLCVPRLASPIDDDLFPRPRVVFHEIEPLPQGGVSAVHGLLSSPEPADDAGARFALTAAHVAPVRRA